MRSKVPQGVRHEGMKCFTVLNIPPPVESCDHWKFILSGVCGMPYEIGHLPPVVQALSGQIMSRIS